MNAPAEQQQAETLNDALSEAFDEMESSEEEIEDVEEEIPEESDEEVPSETDEEASGEEQEAPVTEAEVKQDIEDAAESGFNEPAPERWPEEIKSVYNSLPPEGRQAMLEGIYKPMQASYTRATQELRERQKVIEPMLETMNEYRGDFERMGLNPTEAFRRQMAWASHLAKVGPEQGLKDMQAAYGLQPQDSGQQEQEYLTPMERAMKARLDTLEQHLAQTQQQTTEQQKRQQELEMQKRYQEVERGFYDFVNEQKDGKPAHPHVEAVAPQIAGLLRGGLIPAQDEYGNAVPIRTQLENAYRMACDMNPSLRAARTTGETRQVRKAKAAEGVEVVAKNPASQSRVPDRSLASELEETFESLSRRVS